MNSGEELTIKTMTYALHYQNGEQKQWYTVEVALLSLGTFARFKEFLSYFIKSTEMYKSIFIINFYLRGEFPGFFNFLPVGFFLERNDLQAHYGQV